MARLSITFAAGASAHGIGACGSSGNATSRAASGHSQFVAFSVCMRAHGVPNFPDPTNDGLKIGPGTGLNPRSPAFQSAQKQCFHLLPGGGPQPGKATDQPRMLALAQCMRRHGLTSFPDPTVFQGGGPPADNAIVINGWEFKLGPGLDPMSPAFQQAMNVCGGPRPPGGPKGG